jgi:hypothetical protein
MKSIFQKDRATWNERFQQLSEGIGQQRRVKAENMAADGRFPVGTPYTMDGYDSNRQNIQGQSRSWTASGLSAAAEPKLNGQLEVLTTSACFNCGDPTHWRRDCPVRCNDRRRRTSQQGQIAVFSNPEQTAEIFVRTKIFGRNFRHQL